MCSLSTFPGAENENYDERASNVIDATPVLLKYSSSSSKPLAICKKCTMDLEILFKFTIFKGWKTTYCLHFHEEQKCAIGNCFIATMGTMAETTTFTFECHETVQNGSIEIT